MAKALSKIDGNGSQREVKWEVSEGWEGRNRWVDKIFKKQNYETYWENGVEKWRKELEGVEGAEILL